MSAWAGAFGWVPSFPLTLGVSSVQVCECDSLIDLKTFEVCPTQNKEFQCKQLTKLPCHDKHHSSRNYRYKASRTFFLLVLHLTVLLVVTVVLLDETRLFKGFFRGIVDSYPSRAPTCNCPWINLIQVVLVKRDDQYRK